MGGTQRVLGGEEENECDHMSLYMFMYLIVNDFLKIFYMRIAHSDHNISKLPIVQCLAFSNFQAFRSK